MQLKIRIVDAKFLQFTYEGHILVLVPTGGDLLGCLLPSPIIFLLVQLRVPGSGLHLVGGGGGHAIPSHPHHLNMREYDPS